MTWVKLTMLLPQSVPVSSLPASASKREPRFSRGAGPGSDLAVPADTGVSAGE